MNAASDPAERHRLRKPVSVTVHYRREDGVLSLSKIGYGDDLTDAIRDADEQLRPGAWTRTVVSTENSIRADLARDSQSLRRRTAEASFEGQTVIVPAPQVR